MMPNAKKPSSNEDELIKKSEKTDLSEEIKEITNHPSGKKFRKKFNSAKLAEKLKRIRLSRGLNQTQMMWIVDPDAKSDNRSRISQLELATRMPTILELWNYAKFAKVSIETLIDDKIELPNDFL